MRRAWPLLLMLLLPMLAATALPLSDEWNAHTRYYDGRGALREGGALLFFKQQLPGTPAGDPLVVKFRGKDVVVAVTSGGIIYYLDTSKAVKIVNACAGRVAKVAHASTNRGGILFAVCWKQQDQVMSALTIFDNDGIKWFALKEPSRDASDESTERFKWSDFRSDFPATIEPPAPISADFDGDGYEEIVWYMDGSLLYLDSPLGQPSKTIISHTPRGFAYGDVDGDGKKELVITTTMDILTWRPGERIRHYSGYGCTSEPVLADLDGDGVREVACLNAGTLIAVDGDRLLLRTSGVATLPAAGDINGDGKADLVYVARDGTLIARSLSGVLWSKKVDSPFYSPSLGDVDNDLMPEVVVAAGQYLRIFSGGGKEEWRVNLRDPVGWASGGQLTLQTYVRYEAKTSPVLVDLDGDGLLEVLLGIGAYLEAGRIAFIDDTTGMGGPPVVEILSPENFTTVGGQFTLRFRVSDDEAPVVTAKVFRLVGDWVEEWSGTVNSGESVELTIPSAEEVKVEASDGLLKAYSILKLKVDVTAPQMVIEPRNWSKIGPRTNITVRIISPMSEYAYLTVYHGTGPGGQWVKMIDRRRVWKTTKVVIDVSPLVERLSGYHYFRFVLEDPRGNVEEVLMRYKIEKDTNTVVTREGNVELTLSVPETPVSRKVDISWTISGVSNATLYYGNDTDWTFLEEVSGNGTFEWDVSSLPDGTYKLKLEAGNVSVYAQVEVDNTPPQISITADKTTLDVNETAILTVQSDAIKLYWDLDGDGRYETLGPNVARIVAKEPGKMVINVMGVDEANNSAVASITLEVREPEVQEVETPHENITRVTRTESWTEKLAGLLGSIHLGPELLALPLAGAVVALIMRARSRAKKVKRRRRRAVNPWKSL